ncbi:PAS domain-containing hybrid sensor histidine kinase/response regulator [Humidesulfovibrio idahonensis]
MAKKDTEEKPLCDATELAGLAPVSIMCFNCQGDITFVNDWHIHNFAKDKRQKEDYLGKSIFDLPGIVSSGLAQHIEEVFTGQPIQVENIFTSEFSGGQSGYQSMRAIPVKKDGRLIGGIVIREDVTKYVLSEKKVIDSERKIKALLNASQESAILVDKQGVFLALNDEAAKRRGSTVQDLIGTSSYACLPEESAAQRRDKLRMALREKSPICYQEDLEDRSSTVCIYPVINDSGEVDALAEFSQDITQQIRREKELVNARIMAESANVMKSQFLANISHELRTPLNGILGMAQVGLASDPDEEQQDCLEVIRDSAVRLTNVINNLLDLADIEAGAIEPIIKEFDLAELMRSIANNFSVQAKLKGLVLELSLRQGVPHRVCGDEFRVRQVLVCLMSNALKCTGAGRIEMGVSLAEQPGSGQTPDKRPGDQPDEHAPDGVDLVFHVEDTGVGIEAEKMECIFDSFTLAEDVLTKRRSGVGVGLCIARNLVNLMGGEIAATSSPGRGSRFYFRLRLALPQTCAQDAKPASQPTPETEGTRILLVEDEVINRMMTTTLLRRMGYTVFLAENGVEALRALDKDKVDAILMDIQMPLMDGIEATHHIRRGEVPGLDKSVPIIALTAYAREKDRKRFLELGMDDFVPKPLVAEELFRALEQCLLRRKTAPAN